MNAQTMVHEAYMQALDKLDDAGERLAELPPTVRTFLSVYGAQGVVDNGGYSYFFGHDWPGNPPYEEFISAYEAIGCSQEAADLRRVVETFAFPDAHLHNEKRRAFMDARYDKSTFSVRGWGNALCGDKEVWEKLARYYQMHEDDFA